MCTCESGSDEGEEEDDRCVDISALYEEDEDHEEGADYWDSAAEDLSDLSKSSAPK